MLTTAFNYAFLSRHVFPESPVKGGNPRLATNRPVDAGHVRSITKYLTENEHDYILPPLTPNVRSVPAIHIPRGNFATTVGFVVIGDETRFSITDGQHRFCAAMDFVRQHPEYAGKFTQAVAISVLPDA